jgi:hypothetical protein
MEPTSANSIGTPAILTTKTEEILIGPVPPTRRTSCAGKVTHAVGNILFYGGLCGLACGAVYLRAPIVTVLKANNLLNIQLFKNLDLFKKALSLSFDAAQKVAKEPKIGIGIVASGGAFATGAFGKISHAVLGLCKKAPQPPTKNQ